MSLTNSETHICLCLNLLNLWLHDYVDRSCNHMSLVVRKPVFEVSDQVRHQPGCTTTEDG